MVLAREEIKVEVVGGAKANVETANTSMSANERMVFLIIVIMVVVGWSGCYCETPLCVVVCFVAIFLSLFFNPLLPTLSSFSISLFPRQLKS